MAAAGASCSSWSESPSRRRATLLFDTDDGGQILVSYDAPSTAAAKQRRDDKTTTCHDCAPPPTAAATAAAGSDHHHNRRRPVTDNELQRLETGAVERQIASASSSSDVTDADSKSESRDCCESERTAKTATKSLLPGSSCAASRPTTYDQISGTAASTKSEKERRRSVASVASTAARRQSVGALPPKKSAVHGGQSTASRVSTSAVERPVARSNGTSDAGHPKTGGVRRVESRPASESRSVSTSGRRSATKPITSSLAKRGVNGAVELDDDDAATDVSGASNVTTASLISRRISKPVKGGWSRPAGPSSTSVTAGKRLSLDARPPRPAGPTTSSSGGVTSSRPPPRDVKLACELSRSMTAGRRHGVASSSAGGGRRAVLQGSTACVQPAASLVKSSSTLSLRTDAAAINSLLASTSVR